jgi:C_GCAxxG_C_C family probable redox protein
MDLHNISKDEWENLSRKAHVLGAKYEKAYHGCGQCVLAAIFDSLEIQHDSVFESATGLAGGLGLNGASTCSALMGAVMVFGLIYPRRRSHFHADRENKYRTYRMTQEIQKKYLNQYGSIICHDIHKSIMGRSFDLRNPDEREAFELAGAHDNKCTQVVASAAKWAVEIIGEELIKDNWHRGQEIY